MMKFRVPHRCYVANALGIVAICLFAWQATGAEIVVDCAQSQGVIRPLHGVNGGPLNAGETIDLTKYWEKLGIPLARLHDCDWPSGRIADMHAMFPSLQADPDSPASYNFAQTDDYVNSVLATKARIIFRLGESIEHTKRKYRVHPPADYDRWTAASLGIIRHYNEGWAEGFRHDIQYWEIWNEPENRPAMWTGSDDDYFRLYATTATAIKREFPKLKVGGPAIGATGDVVDGKFQPTEFLQGFMRRVRQDKLPLDFFSWHTYTNDPGLYAQKAKAIRKWLDANEQKQAEIHLNEWNFLPNDDWSPLLSAGQGKSRQQWYDKMGGPQGAAFIACVLLDLQDSPVTHANMFSGDSGPFGLFTQHGEPKKTYHAVRAFRQLLDTPQRVSATGSVAGEINVVAGMTQHKTEVALMISNYRSSSTTFTVSLKNRPWPGKTSVQLFLLDTQHDLDSTEPPMMNDDHQLKLKIPAPGIAFLKLTPAL